MRMPCLALAAAALSAAPAMSPAATELSDRIDRVTLHPGAIARVERVAELTPDEPQGTLRFTGLPASVQGGSVRVAVASGAVTLGAVETAREPVGEPPRERERRLRARIDELEGQRQAARDRAQAARSQITFIEGLAKLPQGEGAAEALTGGDGPDRWQQLWERIGAGSRAAHQRLRRSEAEAERLGREIETLQRRLDQLGQGREEAVHVTVDYSGASGPIALRLRYRVQGPRWQPHYAARLDTAAGALRLVRKAVVRQATGEAWDDVQLRLSTVRPVRGERPEPEPWWIELAPEQKVSADRAAGEPATASLASAEGKSARAAGQAGTVNAEFAATYRIPGRVTVPAGNQPRELTIGRRELAAEVGAEVFAQRDPRAWLTAASQWSGEGPLPAGELSRYRDGAFVGRGRLAGWAPGERRTLAFGIDPRIEVHFEPLRDEAGESGWITTQSTRARRYRLEITNRHDRALPVRALFRVPVPRNEAITVETAFSSPPSVEAVDDKQGVHAWDAELDAGASRAWELGYTVSYPEGRRLRGL